MYSGVRTGSGTEGSRLRLRSSFHPSVSVLRAVSVCATPSLSVCLLQRSPHPFSERIAQGVDFNAAHTT